MTRKEFEKHEEEARDLIEWMGKLSSTSKVPSDFLSKVLARAEQLPLPRRGLLSGLIYWITSNPRIEALALAACLFIFIVWPLSALRTARDREHATLAQIAQLKEEVGKQQELLKELRQLIERVDRQALADFKLGKYKESYEKYLQAAKQEPEKDVYRFRAALALWYDCRFGKAKDLLEKYMKEHDGDAWGYFALGATYHSLGDYQAAILQYEEVIAHNEAEAAEAAWFNLGVIYALEFEKSRNPKDLKRVMSYLEKSIELADNMSIARAKERIHKIQEALKPISQRQPVRCVENYATDDLTSLTKEKVFLDWLQKKKETFAKAF